MAYDGADSPTVVRVQNVASTSFEVCLQNPSGTALLGRTVHCVVLEAGAYVLPDGRAIEAQSFLSTVTDNDSNWNGQAQTYLNSYTQPVILGQVITSNDNAWSVFWSGGSSEGNPASSSSLYCGKHVGEDPARSRLDEMVGFIVVEAGGDAESKAGLGMGIVRGIDNNPSGYTYDYEQPAFDAAPQVTIVTQAAMRGVGGSWAVLLGMQSATSLSVVIDEDQIRDSERFHTSEQVGYMAFAVAGSIDLSPI